TPALRTAFFQEWRRPSPTPSRRATSATESFCSVIIVTAWSLNSGVYALRARAIGVSPLAQSLHRVPAVHDPWGTSLQEREACCDVGRRRYSGSMTVQFDVPRSPNVVSRGVRRWALPL